LKSNYSFFLELKSKIMEVLHILHILSLLVQIMFMAHQMYQSYWGEGKERRMLLKERRLEKLEEKDEEKDGTRRRGGKG
jgi:hypothetical protein